MKKQVKKYSFLREITVLACNMPTHFIFIKRSEIYEIKTGAAIQNPASWMIMEKFGFVRLDKTK